MMRPTVALLIPMLLPGALLAQERVNHRFAIDADASIRITIPAGTVRVVGWDRDTVWTAGVIPKGGAKWYGGGRGKAAKLGVEKAPGAADATGDLEVRVPAGARVWIKTESARIEVVGLTGEMDLMSVTGAIAVQGNPAVVAAETLDGDVTAETSGGILRLRAGGGAITVRTAGGDVTAVSVRGAVELVADRLNRGRLESVTGAVTFTGNLARGGVLDAETHGADVRLRFTGVLDAEFDVASVGGGVVNQLEGKPVVAKGKPLRFTVGTGGAQVTARTFKGTVILLR